jgi:hypothetical protein
LIEDENMPLSRYVVLTLVVALMAALSVPGQAQTQAPAQPQAQTPAAAAPAKAPAPVPSGKVACGPDHAILYKRAVTLLDNAEKKLNARYTAEAKALAKEANALFSILAKECGPAQKERLLSPKEEQQEAINQKLCADERAQADRLMKSAEDKEKKSAQSEAKEPALSLKYQKEAKDEYEQAHKRYIKSQIYALRNQQIVFRFLAP